MRRAVQCLKTEATQRRGFVVHIDDTSVTSVAVAIRELFITTKPFFSVSVHAPHSSIPTIRPSCVAI